MAKEHSFDISARIDKQELKNAIEQAKKEMVNRYDFRGLKAEVDYKEEAKTIILVSTTDNKAEAMFDILVSKAIKRGISPKALKEAKRESVGGGNTKLTVSINDTISSEEAKKIVKEIKELKLKVQVSIRGEEVRVVGKSIDDLQEAIGAIKAKDMEIPRHFINLK